MGIAGDAMLSAVEDTSTPATTESCLMQEVVVTSEPATTEVSLMGGLDVEDASELLVNDVSLLEFSPLSSLSWFDWSPFVKEPDVAGKW